MNNFALDHNYIHKCSYIFTPHIATHKQPKAQNNRFWRTKVISLMLLVTTKFCTLLISLISTIPTYSFLIHDHVLLIKGQKKYIRNVRKQKLTPKFSLKSPHPPLYITTQLISSIFSNCYWMPLGENGTNYMGHYGNKRKIIEIPVFKPPIQEASREKIRFDSSRQTICKYP